MAMLTMELMKIYSQYINRKESLNNSLRELVYINITINIVKF